MGNADTHIQMRDVSREAIVCEARSWLNTPYRRRGAVKHGGCDCGSFPGMVLVNCGIIPRADFDAVMKEIECFADDWFLHQAQDRYMALLSRFATRLGERMTYAKPKIWSGNILLMKTWNSRHRNHAGIVTEWPFLIHCSYEGVQEIDASRNQMWGNREVTIFDPLEQP